ncbi:MAG: DNA-formamidopyrimidine glycosylase family protein, partial [Bacilli bacterium]
MPELPEVETITKLLRPIVVSRKIIGIDILRKTTILGEPEVFVKSLVGESFTDITRVGKFLIFHLTNNKVFLSHLRMEGKYFELDEEEENTQF